MKVKIFKMKFCKKYFFAVVLALNILLLPTMSVKAETTAYMTSAGNANLKVIDISHHDVPVDSNNNYLYGKINWQALKKSVKAIYIKATEGTSITDACYQTLADSAKSAGISHGFFHYFWPKGVENAKQQADFFYNAIKKYGYDCVPVLDVEEANSQSKTNITNAVLAFAGEFKHKSGHDIMIYTSQGFVNKNLGSQLSKYKLWIAHWDVSNPKDTDVWHSFDMWQYSGKPLAVSGLPSPVDVDKATSNIFLNSASGITRIDYPDIAKSLSDITVSGWAISYYGVARVDVYIDGKSIGSVYKTDFTNRSDIGNKYSGAGYDDAANSEYSFTVPDGSLSNGSHVVRVAALNNRGNAVWSSPRTFTVKIPDGKTHLDKPSGTYTGDITASGWAISHFGISRVDIYVDGKYNGTVSNSEMTERTDIEHTFADSGYNYLESSGFSYSIQNASLSGGNHVVQAAAIDNAGKVVWSAQKAFTVNASANKICLDKPSGVYTGDIGVCGWAISHYGIKRVAVYVDGKGTAVVLNSAMTERTAVENTFANKGYNDLAHSGFYYTIAAGKLSAGKHTIHVAMIDNSGKSLWAPERTITVS